MVNFVSQVNFAVQVNLQRLIQLIIDPPEWKKVNENSAVRSVYFTVSLPIDEIGQ